MKKIGRALIAAVIFVLALAVQVSAYMPVYDQMNDIRWFAGYDPGMGLSVISDTAKGVNLKFKYHTQMWANRVVCGGSYNLKGIDPLKVGYNADSEGIYLHLEDIKWDVPKATLSNPKPQTSVMIAICQGEGGWSDGKALMFWIVRDKDNKYTVDVLRGRESSETANMSPEESTKSFHVLEQPAALEKTVGNDIHFYMRRTSSTEWTVNINENEIKLKDSETVKERFVDPSALYVSLGTWSSDANIEYTVSEIWSYGCVEYANKVAGKNVRNTPPAFVQAKNKPPVSDTSKPPATTSKPPVVSNNADTSSTAAVSESSDLTSEPVVSEIIDTSSYEDTASELTSASSDSTDDKTTDANEKKSNPIIYVIIAAIAVVLIGGGVVFYFMFIKKKQD